MSQSNGHTKPTDAEAAAVAKSYYDSPDADRFYQEIWSEGVPQNIHVGFYTEADGETINDAANRTVRSMVSLMRLKPGASVLDLGSGYGGTARVLAKEFGCRVTCVNISEVENAKNREMNEKAGLSHLITVIDGKMENVPADNATFDFVWSQDAMLHVPNRQAVVAEVARVLKPSGGWIFSDLMKSDAANPPESQMKPILDRLRLQVLGSPGFYMFEAAKHGLQPCVAIPLPRMAGYHYSRVRKELVQREQALEGKISQDYIESQKKGLTRWVDGFFGTDDQEPFLVWGMYGFHKMGTGSNIAESIPFNLSAAKQLLDRAKSQPRAPAE